MPGEATDRIPAVLPSYPKPDEILSSVAGQALVVRGLTKFFDGRPVVDHIDLDVAQGSFFGRGRIIATGPIAEVRGQASSLDDAFMHLVGADEIAEGGLEWLGHSRG